MICVKSTEEEGVCYVETKNLDGETNLKNKCVPKDLWDAFDPEMNSIRHHDGKLTIDGPNNLIYKFEGCYETRKEDRLIASNEIEW